jgi:hypothetical protein
MAWRWWNTASRTVKACVPERQASVYDGHTGRPSDGPVVRQRRPENCYDYFSEDLIHKCDNGIRSLIKNCQIPDPLLQ